MMLSPRDELAHSTVRLECDLVGGGVATGTAFFYSLNRSGDQHVPVLVTNKHVVKGSTRGRFLLTLQTAEGNPAVGAFKTFQLDQFEQRWMPHPDATLDLCVMPIAPLLTEAEKTNTKFFFACLSKTLIPTTNDIEELTGTESVTMVGYPNGLWDQTNNLPIFRRGVLATDYKHDWNGRKEFLIDAACFPGSSGSPVMLFDLGTFVTRRGMVVQRAGGRIKLLGILYAGPQYTVEGEIKIVTVPTQQKAISVGRIPNNLGIIIKAEQLNAFEGMFK